MAPARMRRAARLRRHLSKPRRITDAHWHARAIPSTALFLKWEARKIDEEDEEQTDRNPEWGRGWRPPRRCESARHAEPERADRAVWQIRGGGAAAALVRIACTGPV